MIEHTGFLQAFFGVCSGTEIFTSLRKNSWARVILHLILLAILLSIAITAGELVRIAPRMQDLKARVVEEFGPSMELTTGGFRIAKDPDRARNLEISPGILLVYPGDSSKIKISSDERRLATSSILVVSPRCAIAAVNRNGFWIGRAQSFSDAKNFRCSDDNLNSVLSDAMAEADDDWELPENIDLPPVLFEYIFQIIRTSLAIGFFFLWFFSVIILAILYTAVFAIINRSFGGKERLSLLSLSEYWKIGVYAGFPAMLVAAAFPAFSLPFLTYPTVYMLGLVVYWMIAASRVVSDLQTQLSPPPPEEDKENE